VICDFGDVVVVPFPFVNRPIAKRRPAMVLSNARFNDDNGQTVVTMITSALSSSWPSDIAIEDALSAGLAHASTIRWKLFTVPNELILRRAGSLATADRRRALSAARRYLAPTPD
jgi:mRNA interferase MazF